MPFFDIQNIKNGQNNSNPNAQNSNQSSSQSSTQSSTSPAPNLAATPTNNLSQSPLPNNTIPASNVTEKSGPEFVPIASPTSTEGDLDLLGGGITNPIPQVQPQNQNNTTSDIDLMFSPSAPPIGSGAVQTPAAAQAMSVTIGADLQHRLSPNNTDIFAYLELTEQKNASDLHFTVGYPPAIRVDDDLQYIGTEALTQQRAEELFKQITTKEQFDKYIKEKELDFSFNNKSGNRFRVNYYWDRGYMAGAFRLIPGKIRTVEELGLPPILYEFAKYPHGLILLTGPTGSGKSTTIAAMLNEINMNQARHIITVEDPIEYVYPRGKAIINQREVEKDTLSWTRALKYVLRQDPDVVLVGEMRDYETIAAAVTVSETGHLVFATLHTNSAAQTIDRIIDVFPAHQQAQIRSQLANVIVSVISQRLIPLTRGGRKAAVEILIGSSAVKNAIRESKTYQIDNIIQTSAEVGMLPLEKSLAEMVRSGDITLDTALEYSSKPDQLKDLLR